MMSFNGVQKMHQEALPTMFASMLSSETPQHPQSGLSGELEVVALDTILPHEEYDPTRAEPLTRAMAQDRMQRDPIMLARDQGGTMIHLDGANRLTAARQLDCRHIVAQVLDYANPAAVELETWVHVTRIDRTSLSERAQTWPTCRVERLDWVQATLLLSQGQVIALVVFADGEVLALRSGMGLVDRVEALRKLTALYDVDAPLQRETQSEAEWLSGIQALLTQTPQANAGIVFAPLRKDEVITLVQDLRLRLPAGITRHIITGGRMLGVNVPLTLLQADLPAEDKTMQLQALLAGRRRRLYPEPTIQFEQY